MKSAFPPIVKARSKILILGSMPGKALLAAVQYYAFKRNAFWSSIEESTLEAWRLALSK